MRFVHLHTHSHYSLLDGLSEIDYLIAHAKKLGMDALAITDHGVMYGVIEFYQKAKKAGIKPIIGMEAYVAENMYDKRTNESGKNYNHLVLLAENNEGYGNLIKLATAGHLEGFYYKPRIDKELLRKYSAGLIGMSACLGGEISRALLAKQYDKAKKIALDYLEIFGKDNFFLEIQRHPNLEHQELVLQEIIKLSKDTGIPLVATQDSHYLRSEDSQAHDVLLAIQTDSRVDEAGRLSMRNDDYSLLSPDAMAQKFSDFPDALAETVRIADRCNVEITLDKLQLPEFPLPLSETVEQHLKDLVQKKLPLRYSDVISPEISKRVEYELEVIGKTGFASYFLIVADFVNWAREHGIIVGPGRGAAGGSIVSYILGITNIDPIRYNL